MCRDVVSRLSSHTTNVLQDPRASLCVTEPSFIGAADARAVFVGEMRALADDEAATAQAAYLRQHPDAFWVQFGDFTMFRLENIREVSFVGGFARAGTVAFEEYTTAEVDPCTDFAAPVMQHMNEDHEDSLKQYLRWLVGMGPEVDQAKVQMKRLDRFGFDVRVNLDGRTRVLRVPFEDGPVTERKQIKGAIVGLSKKCEALMAASAVPASGDPTNKEA